MMLSTSSLRRWSTPRLGTCNGLTGMPGCGAGCLKKGHWSSAAGHSRRTPQTNIRGDLLAAPRADEQPLCSARSSDRLWPTVNADRMSALSPFGRERLSPARGAAVIVPLSFLCCVLSKHSAAMMADLDPRSPKIFQVFKSSALFGGNRGATRHDLLHF